MINLVEFLEKKNFLINLIHLIHLNMTRLQPKIHSMVFMKILEEQFKYKNVINLRIPQFMIMY